MKMILVGNWKNHPNSLKETKNLLNGLTRRSRVFKKLSTFVAPPAPYLEPVSKRVKSIGALASQDIFSTLDGTFTGVVMPTMLKDFGVRLSIIGHSERRRLGETNQLISQKVKIALKSGITPLLCIGEEVHDIEGGYFGVLSEQIKNSLEGLKKNDAKKLVIAYEPVWAIGKEAKGAMEPAELGQMVIFIKKVLADLFGRKVADGIPVLYGGSVDGDNARELVRSSGVRGFLVGRASLDAKTFGAIAEAITK